MAVGGVGSTTTQNKGPSAAQDASTLGQNMDTFLTLLTTQLKNQDPLSPLDTNQFTQQFVQFASVEQQLKSNATLSALLTTVKASTTSNAASFIGMQVTADGATTRLANGSARGVQNPARNASQAAQERRRRRDPNERADGRRPNLHLGRQDLDRHDRTGRRLHDHRRGPRQLRPGGAGQDRNLRPGRCGRHDRRHAAARHRLDPGAARQRENPRSARDLSASAKAFSRPPQA